MIPAGIPLEIPLEFPGILLKFTNRSLKSINKKNGIPTTNQMTLIRGRELAQTSLWLTVIELNYRLFGSKQYPYVPLPW